MTTRKLKKVREMHGERLVMHQVKCGAGTGETTDALHTLAELVYDENLIPHSINLFCDSEDEGVFTLQMISSLG